MNFMSVTQLLICWYVSHDMLFNEQMGSDVPSNVPTVHKILCNSDFHHFMIICLLHDGLGFSCY